MWFQKNLIKLLVFIGFLIARELIFNLPAEAVTQNLQWTGSADYTVEGTFNYEKEKDKEIIAESGMGKAKRLNSFIVTFYSPSGEIIDCYEDIINGEIKKEYFEFNFDTATQKAIAKIDLGGERLGELFLKGTMGNSLSLIEIEPSGEERILDRSSNITISPTSAN